MTTLDRRLAAEYLRQAAHALESGSGRSALRLVAHALPELKARAVAELDREIERDQSRKETCRG